MVAVAIVLVLLVLVLLSLPFLLDLNRYRDQYLPILEQALHRTVEVQDVRLTFYPTLGVQLREVAIGDDPVFSSTPFLLFPSVQVAVQWKPLLQRRIEVKSVVIESPVVQVVRSEKGDFNFSTMGRVSTDGRTSIKGAEAKDGVSPLLGAFAVRQFSMTGGTLKFEDRLQEPSKVYHINSLILNTESVAIGETARVQMQGILMPYQIPLDVSGRFGPLQENFDVPTFDIEGLVGKVAINAKGKIIKGQVIGDVQIPKASTRDIPMDFGLKKPIEVSQLQAHLVASIISRDPKIASDRMRIDPLTMNLHVGQSTIHVTGKGVPSQFSLVGQAPIFHSEDIPVPHQIQKPFALEQLEFWAELQGEMLNVTSLKAKAFDGTLSAQGMLNRWSPPFTFSTQGAFKDFSAEALMKVMPPTSLSLTGIGEFEWKVNGLVPSSARPEFDGPTNVTLRDGQILGFDLIKIIEDSLQMAGMLGPSTGTTKYSVIEAQTALEKDGLAIRRLTGTAPNFLLQGAGKIGLDQSVNLKGTVGIHSSMAEKIIQRFPMAKVVRQEGQLTLPFVIRGTVQNPKLKLDTQSLGNQVKKKIEKRLEKVLQGDNQELQKLLDEGKDLLKQFFRK